MDTIMLTKDEAIVAVMALAHSAGMLGTPQMERAADDLNRKLQTIAPIGAVAKALAASHEPSLAEQVLEANVGAGIMTRRS